MERFNDMAVYRNDGIEYACVFTKDINSISSIDPDKLDWHKDAEDVEYLTLQEIGDQVYILSGGIMPVLYVWVEGPLRGEIYQTGNYPGCDDWILYGKTNGYA